MDVIPAIDLQNGKCVRLFKGLKDRSTIYSTNPLEMLFYWEDLGAEIIHIIDLDGAFGKKSNIQIVEQLLKHATSRLEVGGGIRSFDLANKLYSMGVERIIIGTAAIENPSLVLKLADEIGSKHIVVALDYRGGKVVTKGWEYATELDVYEVANLMERNKAGWILFSSVEADGTLEGPDITGISKMVQITHLPVIAAGGISSLIDVRRVTTTKAAALVIGKALYEKKFSFSEALEICKAQMKEIVK
ncbi:MAG: 1-(5-phosphoribosyl)-5-[(5-phosphoribosylamino)methylideneamino]imidazole-4-carboxamide isomerase [Candidatus Helarchaeota archaeon]